MEPALENYMMNLQKIKLNVKGKDLTILAQKIDKNIWIYFDGRTYALPLENGAQRNRKKSGSSAIESNRILAPMPGKITKILLSEGQSVEQGKVAIVMEAMKMEYTLKAEISAKIKKIAVKIGDQVSLGQTLIEFETKSVN
jgi:acetyl/propionyl-CoA carboxylase alpha subunit